MENMPMLQRDDLSDSSAVRRKLNEYQKQGSSVALGYLAKRLLDERDALRAKLAPSPCNVPGHCAKDWVKEYAALVPDESPNFKGLTAGGYCRLCAELEKREQATWGFIAYVEETASHAMCHADTYTLEESQAALYRIHNKADELRAAHTQRRQP